MCGYSMSARGAHTTPTQVQTPDAPSGVVLRGESVVPVTQGATAQELCVWVFMCCVRPVSSAVCVCGAMCAARVRAYSACVSLSAHADKPLELVPRECA